MSNGPKRSTETARKKGANRNEQAIKHPKTPGSHVRDTDNDVREDRGIRKQKLGKHPSPPKPPHGTRSF